MFDSLTENKYDLNLDKNQANYAPLTPISFLRRTAEVFPDHIAIVHGDLRRTYKDMYDRCRKLASALTQRGIGPGDTVAVMAPNVPEVVEAHFGVPMTGAVLNTINMRLDPDAIAFTLEHGEAKVLFTDREFSETVEAALSQLASPPLIIDIDDPLAEGGALLGEMDYEAFIADGDAAFAWEPPADEWQAIALNYTSGTTGNPKGVVYSHRGAYLNSVGQVMAWDMNRHPTYLWTLPLFHCNGWCFPWALAAVAGTNVCLRKVDPKLVFELVVEHKVSHLCGAPTVMIMLLTEAENSDVGITHDVNIMTGGASPPAAVIARVEALGFNLSHVYGLTEVYGPDVICAWHRQWNGLELQERAALAARQGVRYEVAEDMMVADPETLEPVPQDGESLGEIMMRGNIVMKGYLKNPSATEEAFAGGWFHTGDLGVWHADGYVELKDRSKDIIISGGENISTVEVESVIYQHPAVLEAAVVARPDEKWGETPCAFVTLKDDQNASEQEIIEFCRERIARFKCPKTVVFSTLPKTATGKIQKFALREQARSLPNADDVSATPEVGGPLVA